MAIVGSSSAAQTPGHHGDVLQVQGRWTSAEVVPPLARVGALLRQGSGVRQALSHR